MSIEVKSLSKNFGSFKAVDQVAFKVETGELMALLGPSGSGKSTLLRMIAGLEQPDSGEVILTGQESTTLSARERNVGFVFQHYALFKHMTVRENIAFGLSVRKAPKDEIKDRVEELLGLVQMQGYGGRYPSPRALGRPAPARGCGQGPGSPAQGAAAGRAFRGPRRQGEGRAARLDPPPARGQPDDHGLCHP